MCLQGHLIIKEQLKTQLQIDSHRFLGHLLFDSSLSLLGVPCICLCYVSILHKTKKTKALIGTPSIQKFWALLKNCSWIPWWLWHSWCFMFHGNLLMDSLMTLTLIVFHVSWQTPPVQLLYQHFSHKWLENIRTIADLDRKISSFKDLCVWFEEWDSAFTSDLIEHLFWGYK